MNFDKPVADVVDRAFNILTKSVETRLSNSEGTNLVDTGKELELLNSHLGKSDPLSDVNSASCDVNETPENIKEQNDDAVSLYFNDVGAPREEENNLPNKLVGILDDSILLWSFTSALYGTTKSNDSFDNRDLLEPPPVPVTSEFRRYNQQAASIFDHTDVELLGAEQLHRHAIYRCLKSPSDYSRLVSELEKTQGSLLSTLESSIEQKQYLSFIRLLLSWYYSGYFMGRMECIREQMDGSSGI